MFAPTCSQVGMTKTEMTIPDSIESGIFLALLTTLYSQLRVAVHGPI